MWSLLCITVVCSCLGIVFWRGACVAVVCGPPAKFINCCMSFPSLATQLPYLKCCFEATDYWMLLGEKPGWYSSTLCALSEVPAVTISCEACSFKCFLQTWMYLFCAFVFELILKFKNFSCFSFVPACNKVSFWVTELETVVDWLGLGLARVQGWMYTGSEELSWPLFAAESWLQSAVIELFCVPNARGSWGAEKPWC